MLASLAKMQRDGIITRLGCVLNHRALGYTANAMAVRITGDGPERFCDPLGGLEAIRQRILDTPAAPEVSFGDDPLRMLRAARFVSQLEFESLGTFFV